MCYPCTQCGACGKFDVDSPLYQPPPDIPCLLCGGLVDPATGICTQCQTPAFAPPGTRDGGAGCHPECSSETKLRD